MLVRVVEVLEDNFSYLIVDEGSKTAAAVDPVEPEKVRRRTCWSRSHQLSSCNKNQQAHATMVYSVPLSYPDRHSI